MGKIQVLSLSNLNKMGRKAFARSTTPRFYMDMTFNSSYFAIVLKSYRRKEIENNIFCGGNIVWLFSQCFQIWEIISYYFCCRGLISKKKSNLKYEMNIIHTGWSYVYIANLRYLQVPQLCYVYLQLSILIFKYT